MNRNRSAAVAVLGALALAQPPPSGVSESTAEVAKTYRGGVEAETAMWPQFRGPNASGVSHDRDLPVEFGPTRNVIWKTPIPQGNSSPCVWADCIFLTAFEDSQRLVVLCIDRGDGRIRWKRDVPAKRIEKVHPRVGSPASPTPATDGQRVYVFFGSVGLVAFDYQGQTVWKHDLGPFTYHLGRGAASSPIVCGDTVILNCDHDGESFLLAIRKETGQVKWRTPRPQAPPSYSTPILWNVEGQDQLIISGSGRVVAYDAETGKVVWHVWLPEAFIATTPILGRGLLFVAAVDRNTATGDFRGAAKAKRMPNFDLMFANHDGNRDGRLSPKEVPQMTKKTFDRIDASQDGFLTREELEWEFQRQQQGDLPAGAQRERTGNVLLAIRPGGRGNVTDTHVAWRVARTAPYVPSPLSYGDYVYVVKGGGIASCFDAATGNLAWKQRIGASGAYYASPVAGDGKVYLISEAGDATVLAAGPEPSVLGRSSLGERCLATPAIFGGMLYIRTQSNLYCFGERQ
ncbi:MAG: outer membrane protein assembly factor BamB family protein [Planctomycetota bacterium]|jgi:outer membrane protein assembly factor BamB